MTHRHTQPELLSWDIGTTGMIMSPPDNVFFQKEVFSSFRVYMFEMKHDNSHRGMDWVVVPCYPWCQKVEREIASEMGKSRGKPVKNQLVFRLSCVCFCFAWYLSGRNHLEVERNGGKHTLEDQHVEPNNEGLLQMIFLFKQVIFRFQPLKFPGCNTNFPDKNTWWKEESPWLGF